MNKKNRPVISVIIPTYDEEKTISDCLGSLAGQTYRPLEIIVVDDGSTDKTLNIIENLKLKIENLQLLKQQHLGPGPARNLGASKARGKILVFVDADMTFDKNFIKDLVAPILGGKSIGTFSKNEMNVNPDNVWSACWQINRNWPLDRLIPPDYPDTAPVFRAILKKEFERVSGFETTGEYTDDWSLSRKLKLKSTVAYGAVYYHSNPATLGEVFKQARWIGKNEFISGNLLRRFKSLVLYSLPVSALIGFYKSVTNLRPHFLIFKVVYDLAVWVSIIKSFFGEAKSK